MGLYSISDIISEGYSDFIRSSDNTFTTSTVTEPRGGYHYAAAHPVSHWQSAVEIADYERVAFSTIPSGKRHI
jgi:hypothetical protein